MAGIASGLTVGYLSIDNIDLEIKIKTGNENEKKAVIILFKSFLISLTKKYILYILLYWFTFNLIFKNKILTT